MIKRFQKNHHVICTSRNYREVTQLAKLRKLSLKFVGKHGGVEKFDKLLASANRISLLSKIIRNYCPEIAVSFCSPEASRVSYGLGIKHIAFSDSPHAEAVMRLSVFWSTESQYRNKVLLSQQVAGKVIYLRYNGNVK